MAETVFITGIMGQDGAYLAELMLKQGKRVVGGVRRSSTANDWRLRSLGVHNDVELVDFELLEYSLIHRLLERIQPNRVFNLAAQSFVGASFEQPLFTSDVDAMGPLRMLEVIRAVNPDARFYQASTSELYGKVVETPQSEMTAFYPRSPYAVAKAFAHYMTRNYREAYGMHASAGILFNHESPLRGQEFVTRKITVGLARIANGTQDLLELGNMDAKRDWGHARDYVAGMALMTEQEKADEYVLATGVTTSVRDFVDMAARATGFDLEWSGEGIDETARDRKSGKLLVQVNPAFFRPTEVELLLGDPAKARAQLGWNATTTIEELATEMAEADLRRTRDTDVAF